MSALARFAPLQHGMISRRRPRALGSITWGTRSMQWRNRGLGSITWGTRTLGALSPLDSGSGFDFSLQQGAASPDLTVTAQPFPGNPDTLPGAWPGLNPQPPAITATTLPAQVPIASNPSTPVVVTPTSGAIPPPAAVAAATAPVSWLDQSLIAGIANKWLLLGGVGAFLFFGGKSK